MKALDIDQMDGILAQIPEASNQAVVITRQDGVIIGINPKTEELFGYSRDELLGHKPEMLMPRGLSTLRWSRFRQHYAEHDADYAGHSHFRLLGQGLNLWGRRCDGVEFPIEVSLGLVEMGTKTLLSAGIRDITEGRRAEELAAYLAAIVEASDDAIVGIMLSGIILSWNKGAEKLCGYTENEVVGRSVMTLMPTGQPIDLLEMMKQLRRGRHIESYETKCNHKDGHQIDVSVRISPVLNKERKVVSASVIARDINRIRQAEAELRLSEERFRVALKNAPVVVFTQDLQLRYTWISSSVRGSTYQDYIGRTDDEIVGGEEGSRLTLIKQEVLRTGVGLRTETTVRFVGVTRHFDLVVEPATDGKGAITGLICSATDTTPWRNLIVKLQDALGEVQLLSGLLSICASCKRIKQNDEKWESLETYISEHSEVRLSHGLCPECLKRLYPEYSPSS
jgi:PAS domain S-box-containing protein